MTSSWSKERFKSDKILKNFKIFEKFLTFLWEIYSKFGKFSHFLENFEKIWNFSIILHFLENWEKILHFWEFGKDLHFLKILHFFEKKFFKILPCLQCSVIVFCGTLSEILNFFRVFSLLFFFLQKWFLHVICYNDVFMVKRAFSKVTKF